jgi:aspartyl-tRNA(Asn)/glutamyl-tRNA(Gln) amidotransferase subunit C
LASFLRLLPQKPFPIRKLRCEALQLSGVPSDSGPVSLDMVRHVAALARLRVPEEELPALTHQLARILSYIDQLKEIQEQPESEPILTATPLRDDEFLPGGGRQALEENAPRLLHDHGAVPRVVGGVKP